MRVCSLSTDEWPGKGYSNKWGLFLTLLLWITQHHPHLSWAVFPHLCCGSDITASPSSICCEQRTPSCINSELIRSATLNLGEVTLPPCMLSWHLSKEKAGNPSLLHQDLPHLEDKRGQFHCDASCLSVCLMATECEDCQWVEVVVWLPRRAYSFPPNQPLIGCSHNRGKGILPIGNNWCFVAGPNCPDMELMFIGTKIPPQVRKGCTLIKCCYPSCNNYRRKLRWAFFDERILLICHCSSKNWTYIWWVLRI